MTRRDMTPRVFRFWLVVLVPLIVLWTTVEVVIDGIRWTAREWLFGFREGVTVVRKAWRDGHV